MTGIDWHEIDLAFQTVFQVAHEGEEGAGLEVRDGDIDIGLSRKEARAYDRSEQDSLVELDR